MHAAVDAFYDWQGGLVWMRMEAEPEGELIRHVIHAHGGGHATLMRASEAMRAETDAFEPLPSAVLALSTRIKQQIDPAGVFASGGRAGN
jgi:glycolate oxidase FAD binding subunit